MPARLQYALGLLALLPLLAAGDRRAVARCLAGALLVHLGVAGPAPEWAMLLDLPLSFTAVSAGFVLLGLALIVWAIVGAARDTSTLLLAKVAVEGPAIGLGIALVLLLFLELQVWPLLRVARWYGPLAALVIGAVGALALYLLGAIRAGAGVRWLDDRFLARWRGPTPALLPRLRRPLIVIAVAGVVTALFVRHFAVAVLGAVVGTWALHDLLRPTGKVPRWGLQPFVVLLTLGVALWFVWTIAGAEIPLSLTGLGVAPFSDAAEMTLAVLLGAAAWTLLGLWPLHGQGPASALAVVGGVFLLRWGMTLVPDGMQHAGPLFGAVAAIGACHAAATRRSGAYAATIGLLAVAGGAFRSWWPFVLASVPGLFWLAGRRSPIPGLSVHQLVGIGLVATLAPVLPIALRGETVYTTVALGAGVALFLGTAHARPA